MSAPLTDIHVRHVIELGLKTIRANPDHHLKDIFGDAKIDAHAALYGQRMIDQVKTWITSTEIPVVLGFDVNEAKMPAVTINVSSSTPMTQAIGDVSLPGAEPLNWQEKEVVVPGFQPKEAILAEDRQSMTIVPPDSMPFEQKELLLPGLTLRDGRGRDFILSLDKDCNVIALSDETPIDQIDLTKLEVLSPVIDARYSRGAMVYEDTITIAVHGHAERQEGIWLYYIVMWTLLKFRPVLTAAFGLDLSVPMASDFQRDDIYAGNQVWRRYITMKTTTVWSWEAARQKDVLGLLLSIQYDRAEKTGPKSDV